MKKYSIINRKITYYTTDNIQEARRIISGSKAIVFYNETGRIEYAKSKNNRAS